MGLKCTASKMHSPHKKDIFFKKGVKLDRSAVDRSPGEVPAGAWGLLGAPWAPWGCLPLPLLGWKKEGLNQTIVEVPSLVSH